ncbi:MAG: phosphatase PAP2 family protein [Prevotella sp.]|nr:phosphatase PAP2 family protein [Prevotella sp.]
MSLERLIELDQSALFFFNGSDSMFIDGLAFVLTSGLTWLPLYLALLYLVVKNNETMAQIGLIIGCSVLCIILADGISEHLFKPWVARPRPSNDPIIKYSVHIVNNIRGMDYSFFSAHAANTMSIAIFFSWLVRSKLLSVFLILWSFVNCWTRMYLGLHYPGDISVGLLWGFIVGSIVYLFFRKIYFLVRPKLNYVSSQYTRTGYALSDVHVVITVLLLTFCYAVIRGVTIIQ